jgi:hypothetical protein
VGTRDSPGALYGLPAWLARYVAFCVEFVREEREALERVLEARFRAENDAANATANANADATDADANANPSLGASSAEGAAAEAKAEAEGVAAARLQSLAVTLDKVRHVLSEACGGEDKLATAPPPLAALDDAAAAAHLAATRRRVADAARALGVAVPDGVPRLAGEKTKSEYDELVDARRALAELATFLRSLEKSELSLENANEVVSSGLPIVDFESVAAAARAAADLCDLASITKTFFRAVPSKPFDSPFVQVGAYGGDAGTVRRASYGPLVVWAFLATWHCEFEEHAELSLDNETRGATRLPRPDGPLRRALLTGVQQEEGTNVGYRQRRKSF